jgi:hypothetical protein
MSALDIVDDVVMETGGFLVGRNRWLCIYATWGFGVLEIARECLVLDTTWTRYTFTQQTIVRLSTRGSFISSGVRIEHSVPRYPRFLAFTTFRLSRVVQRLREAGYHVDDKKA